MASATLAIDAALALATALVFAYVGQMTLRRRPTEIDGARALRRFAAWWFGLAAYTLVGGLRSAMAAAGNLDLTLHAAVSNLSTIPLVVLLWGVVSYLAYIYTGRRAALTASTVLHVAILVFYAGVLLTFEPVAVRAQTWTVSIDYADGGLPGWVTALVLFSILGPTLAAAVGYASLYFRTRERNARYRIAMVSSGFLLWFGSAAVASLTPIAQAEWWPPASRLLGILATAIILAAYRPPAWVRVRFGIEPVETSALLHHARVLHAARA